ncbi:hypothetical protein QJS10_CPA05g02367 [Acorus calamus]|uniref:CCHC-type domain-containing protein n=1 Tax=Acorus calamus TaxID=4465 RepID=A0AAV9EVG7_ACOCL|nr:hypothetical protein QJS10_CPA05g02367 [Acorus calamus]
MIFTYLLPGVMPKHYVEVTRDAQLLGIFDENSRTKKRTTKEEEENSCWRGRPKKKRIRDPNKKKRRHKCTRCKEFGHHRSSCKNPIAELSVQSASIEREGQSNTSRHPQVSDVGTPNPPGRNEEFSSQASIGSTGRMEGQPQRARRGNFQDRRL